MQENKYFYIYKKNILPPNLVWENSKNYFFLKIKTDFFCHIHLLWRSFHGKFTTLWSLKYSSSENCTFSFPALISPLPIVKSYNKAWAKLSSFFKNLSVFRSLRFSTIWDKTLPYLNVSHTRANNCFLFCKIKINNTHLPYFCR